MNFTYEWSDSTNSTLRRSDRMFIPLDPQNIDYQAYLAWVAEGNEAQPYVAPEPPAPPTPAEKLAASGLSVDELKELLGL